ncbi:MAG: hypothetical protein WC343_06900 [Bacilli bacterium]|jgi:hypothetical protein
MNLFSKEKEIIFKITNAILLIWLIGAAVVACSSIIRLVVKEPVQDYTYDEYEITNCSYYKEYEDMTDTEIDQRCLIDYNNYKFNNENGDYYKVLSLYIAIANMLIVGGVMFFINKQENRKTNKQ